MAEIALKVRMSCQGCAGAVRRVLDKMEGVESYDINMEQQKVTVKGTATPEAVLETVSKTGKKAEFWKDEAEIKEKEIPPAAPVDAPPAPAAIADATDVPAPDAATDVPAPAAADAPAAAEAADAPSAVAAAVPAPPPAAEISV